MGSTGSGNFSDYSSYNQKNSSSSGGGQSGNGGSSGEDQCARAFSTSLDEVATCDYYKTRKNVPAVGSGVSISFNARLVVLDHNDICVGYLPTKFNYLRACMSDGFTYSGVINQSTTVPFPSISIDIAPNHE